MFESSMISDETSDAVRRIQNFAAVSVPCCVTALVIRVFLSSLSPLSGLRGRWISLFPLRQIQVAVFRTDRSLARWLRSPRRQA